MKPFAFIACTIGVVLFLGWAVGCDSVQPETPDLPVVQGPYWTNSLGMRFLPVPGKRRVLMSVWETRVRDFEAFYQATGHEAGRGYYYYENFRWQTGGRDWRNPGFDQTPDHPVTGISWGDAAAFCHWLTEHEQRRGIISRDQYYRLPGDEEWTLAATPGVDWPIPTNAANYSPEMGVDMFGHTSPVGSFPPNRNGFFDLAGNLWEYCHDPDPAGEDFRVIRGGCWQNSHRRFIGIKSRGACGMHVRISLYGFRVVLADELL